MPAFRTELARWTSFQETPGSHSAQGDGSILQNGDLPVYSMDEIALQLTNGYWGGSS